MVTNNNVAGNPAKDPLAQNGKETTTAEQKPVENKTEGHETKAEVKLATIVPAKNGNKVKPELPPLEDRIYKVQQLTDLVYRREKLQEGLKKLKPFKISTDGRADSIRIQDGQGHEWNTSNSNAIKDVIAALKASLQKQLDEVENLITF